MITNIGIIFTVVASVVAPTGVGLKYYADHEYVTVASQNLKERFNTEDELEVLRKKVERGTATQDDLTRIEVLKDRLKLLKQ